MLQRIARVLAQCGQDGKVKREVDGQAAGCSQREPGADHVKQLMALSV